MDFINRHFGKMHLRPVKHFFHHKRVPVVLQHCGPSERKIHNINSVTKYYIMKTTLPDKLELRPLLFCIFLSICMSRSKPASKLSLTNLSFPVTVSPVLADYVAKYLGFFSSRSLKTREKYIRFAQLVFNF